MNVLVISTHPDDEALGCAGTLLKHRAKGDSVRWCIATAAWTPKWTAEQITAKSKEIQRAAAHYQVSAPLRAGLQTTRLDALPLADVVDALAPAFASPADVVYLTNPHDTHTDHRVVFEACWTLMKPFRTASRGPKRILVYETLSSTDAAPPLSSRAFQPNVWSDITPWIAQKCEAMAIYASEAQPDPLPRGASAIRALARVRGAQVGVEYAEAFQLLRDFE
jgi:LmbE family N-acetylglucosaminyl deacetylase